MPLGTEVDLGPGHIALQGDPAPPRKGHSSPALFSRCQLWPRSPILASAELLFVIVVVVSMTEINNILAKKLVLILPKLHGTFAIAECKPEFNGSFPNT